MIICLNVETYGKTTRGRMMNKYDDPLTIIRIQDAPFSEETKSKPSCLKRLTVSILPCLFLSDKVALGFGIHVHFFGQPKLFNI